MKSLCMLALGICLAALNATPAAQARHVNGRALLIGINQYQDPAVNPVKGAEEDVQAMEPFIREKYGFTGAEVHTLTGKQATRAAILREFSEWLIGGTRPGDHVFLLFSGHGSQLPDDNGDEADHYDETIVPYDVDPYDPKGRNQIRDDELDGIIAQLSGRLSVMVFDSCHSGTITRAVGGKSTNAPKSNDDLQPRYLPNPKAFAALRAQNRDIGGKGATNYEIADTMDEKLLVTRDLHLVEEKTKRGSTGLIVISASRPDQVAFPLRADNGDFRGALSYAFCQTQGQAGALTLQQLESSIKQQIADWQKTGRLKGQQTPVFEIISTTELKHLPLFPVAPEQLALPVIALANPASPMKVTLRNQKPSYRIGEKIFYEVTTSASGWLYVLVFSEKDVATCVFPTASNEDDRDNRVVKGTHRLPRSAYFYAQKPVGKDIVVALLSSVQLNLGDQENMSWNEVLDRLSSKKLAGFVRSRGVGTKKPGQATAVSLTDADWQAASLVIETTR